MDTRDLRALGSISLFPLLLAACMTRLPAAAPSTSPSPASDTRDEINAAYENFWSVGNKISHDEPTRWRPELAAVAIDPQLARMLTNLNTLQSRSITVYGTTHEHVTKIDVEGATATVTDCQDASQSGQADALTGERKTVGIPRNPVTARMQRGADGKWQVAEISYPGGTC